MKFYVKPLIMGWMLLMFSFTLPINHEGNAFAAEADIVLEEKLIGIESRLRQARLIIKKLKHDYLLAVKSNQMMRDEGLAEADINQIEREFKKKVEKMIEVAMDAMNDV